MSGEVPGGGGRLEFPYKVAMAGLTTALSVFFVWFGVRLLQDPASFAWRQSSGPPYLGLRLGGVFLVAVGGWTGIDTVRRVVGRHCAVVIDDDAVTIWMLANRRYRVRYEDVYALGFQKRRFQTRRLRVQAVGVPYVAIDPFHVRRRRGLSSLETMELIEEEIRRRLPDPADVDVPL